VVPQRWTREDGLPRRDRQTGPLSGVPKSCPAIVTQGCSPKGVRQWLSPRGFPNGFPSRISARGFHQGYLPGGFPQGVSPVGDCQGVPGEVPERPAGEYPRGCYDRRLPCGGLLSGFPKGHIRLSLKWSPTRAHQGVYVRGVPQGYSKVVSPQGSSHRLSPKGVHTVVHLGNFPRGRNVIPQEISKGIPQGGSRNWIAPSGVTQQ
jgi:hypothetical protein